MAVPDQAAQSASVDDANAETKLFVPESSCVGCEQPPFVNRYVSI